ncbi:unnamed protein product [Oncorhynchus mykiss]|uniref:Uncharacterized protein n=1 Tax=Oncorhynchus mykiss TaxID=8022 RepID=A0A060YZS1_ONCMY|nr:unnamed protein product [Oncorhynchus mykiss]
MNLDLIGNTEGYKQRQHGQHPTHSKNSILFTDGHTSEDSKAKDGKYSTSFEEYQDDSEDHPDHISRLSHVTENSIDTRPSSSLTKSSRKSQSVCSYTAESKYLGSLKVLDRKVQLKEAEPGSADSLRAAIYQVWAGFDWMTLIG